MHAFRSIIGILCIARAAVNESECEDVQFASAAVSTSVAEVIL